jgi:WD40 repeat protein
VAVAPDGTWLATCSRDGTARIWDPTTGWQRATLTGHGDAVTAVAIAPDGSWLATGSNDGTVRIWDPVTGQERATLTGHDAEVDAMVVAPDGSWLATAGSFDGTVRIWDVATRRERAALTGPACIPGAKASAAACPGQTTPAWSPPRTSSFMPRSFSCGTT